MPSKVDALVKSFLQTDGDALYLVPGERMFLVRGSTRSVVGREALSSETFQALSDELVPGVAPDVLAHERHRVPFQLDPASEAVEIRFGLSQGQAAIMVARVRRAPAEAPAAPAAPPAPAVAAPPAAAPPVPAAPAPARPPARPTPPPSRSTQAPPVEPERVPPEPLSYTTDDESEPKPAGPPSVVPLPFEPDGSLSRRPGAGVKKLDDVLPAMVEAEASDLLLSAGSVPIFRVHGELVPQSGMVTLRSEEVEKVLLPLTPERHRKELAERNETAFACEVRGLARFRVCAYRDHRGAAAVLHRIPLEAPTVEQLRLPEPVVRLADRQRGLVLIVGFTGSGKTTTLAALVDRINRTRTGHLVTLEDPIEVVHQSRRCLVNQREVGSTAHGVPAGLRAALAAGADVLVIGEIRDAESMALALAAAESGRLVLATLAAPSATSAVERVLGEVPEERQPRTRALLADTLRGVVAQTLCRKAGGGRVAAFEVMIGGPAVANLIRDGKTLQLPAVLQASRAAGMCLLDDAIADLVRKRLVAPKEAVARASDGARLLDTLRAEGLGPPAGTGERTGSATAHDGRVTE